MWTSIACAVQGRSHIKGNIPCQDKTFFLEEGNFYAIALADGAGSATLSHHGAESVTKHICEDLRDNFDSYFDNNDGIAVKKSIVSGVLDNLDGLTQSLSCDVKDLASTLLFVAVKDNRFILAHIGDGVIGYLKHDELKIASAPENGEFVNTTVFTTSKSALTTMKLIKGSLDAIQGFVLMSDGAEASLYDKCERKLANVLKKIMDLSLIVNPLKVQEQLKHSFETVISKATSDDCSIAILVKDKADFDGYLNLSDEAKCSILKLDYADSSIKRKLKRYNTILEYLQESRTLAELAREIHLKEKFALKHIDKLRGLNLVESKNGKFQTILTMNKDA